MSGGVEFDEDNMGFRRPMPGGGFSTNGTYRPQQGGMAGWLMRHGLAKSSGAAQAVMIGIVIVNAIIMYVLIKFFI